MFLGGRTEIKSVFCRKPPFYKLGKKKMRQHWIKVLNFRNIFIANKNRITTVYRFLLAPIGFAIIFFVPCTCQLHRFKTSRVVCLIYTQLEICQVRSLKDKKARELKMARKELRNSSVTGKSRTENIW